MKFLTLFIAFLILSICNVVGQTVFTVTNTNDSGAGSLRQAILDANGTAGTDTIAFDIPGAGPHTIQPTFALPNITDPVIIDGTTEPDFAGTPIIELDGTNAGSITSGLRIISGNSRVRGLVINRFGENGIRLESGGNIIHGNYIGTDVTGTVALGNSWDGVRVWQGAQFNIIGGATEDERNIISGNNECGINLRHFGTNNNTVSGNYIGVDVNGTIALGNLWDGVRIQESALSNIIGGTTDAKRNIISGNNESGVNITGSGTDSNTVSGNYIGTDVNGTVGIPNGDGGVEIANGARFNLIGGTTVAERNIISGNDLHGVNFFGSGTTGNLVQGNFIGTDVTGTVALGNSDNGIVIIFGASSNTVGGITEGERNIISGNNAGVSIFGAGTSNNIVSGNYIGTDVTGTVALGDS